MPTLHRTLRRVYNAAAAGLAVAVAYWDTAATGPAEPVRTTMLFPDDHTSAHITRRSDGVITGTLAGPFGHLTGEPAAFERLANTAALLATAIRVRRDAAAEGMPA
ncbi:hypothetical protein [Kitasatospora sp. NPDC058478]|uniref:hypothetical protein n=1 Tax=unclassified Kitasatospora TaxID=2633591 RepID=UPI00364647C0